MKKRVKLKRKTVSLIVKNLIVLVALAAVALAAVFSWFTDHPEVDSSGVSATVEVNQSLEYFIVSPEFTAAEHTDNDQSINVYQAVNKLLEENAEWNADPNNSGETPKIAQWRTGEVSLDPDLNPELGFLSDLALSDITSDGKTFKIPKLIQHQHITYVDTDAAFSDATPNKEYLSFDIYFRCPQSCTVVMKNNSTISPVGTPSSASEQGIKNAAVGAVRLSAVDARDITKFIWIPAPSVWYDGREDPGTLYTSEDLRDLGTNAGGNVTSDGHTISLTSETTKDHAYYSQTSTTQNDTTVYTTTRNVMDSSAANSIVRPSVEVDNSPTYQLPDNESLVTLLPNGMNDGYNYGRIRINLWIEGEDAEARLALVDGQFNINLVFDAIATASEP